MTIQELGSLGELVGGIAVILSVIYLALQIRHGINGYQSMITQQVTNHFSQIQLEVGKDPALYDLWYRAQQGQEMSDREAERAQQILSCYLISFENLFFQYRNRMLDKEAWNARRPILGLILHSPVPRAWWETRGRAMHPSWFVKEVEAVLVEVGNQ